MIVKKYLYIVYALLFFVSFNAYAGVGWSVWFTPDQVEIEIDGIRVSKGSSFQQVSVCPNLSWVYFTGNDKLEDRALSAAMFAQSAGKEIRAYRASCDPSGNFIQATMIQMRPKQ